MTRLQWMTCWDRLRRAVVEGQTSWGKNQLLSLIDSIEREEVRKIENEAATKAYWEGEKDGRSE